MRNLKKLFALVVVFAMLVTVSVPAFAAASFSYEAEAQTLNDLGLYKGLSDEVFTPDLGAALNRETGVVMLLRIFGLEAEAEALSAAEVDATLGQFKDAAAIADWAKASVAYAVSNGLVNGLPDGTFAPKANLVGKAYCTLILRQLGYTPNYDTAAAELADADGLTTTQAIIFSGKALIKDDLVGISFGALSAVDTEGNTVIANLVADGVVDEAAAVDAGLMDSQIAAAADAAVAAYEAAPITTIDEVAAAEALGVAAADAVALLADSAEKGALQAKVGTQDAKVAAAKASLTALNATAAQSGAKTIKVTFSRALTAEEQTAATVILKKGLVPYTVSSTFNTEATTATLAYAYNLPTGTYTLTVGGVATPITVTVAAPVVSKIVINDESYQLKNNVEIDYTVFNQFNEEMSSVSNISVSAYNATGADTLAVDASNLVDFIVEAAEKDDNIIVTISHSTTGVIASKTVPVISAANVTVLGFDAVQPLEDTTRITTGDEGLVLPYTFQDQYGAAYTLAAHTANQDGVADKETIDDNILFISSNVNIVNPDTFVVDDDGVLTFDTESGAGFETGTVIITALVPSTGASAIISVKVEADASLKTFTMEGPSKLVVDGEAVEISYSATDSFDAPIAVADFDDYYIAGDNLTFVSSNTSVVAGAGIVFDAKNKLQITPIDDGTTTIYAYVDGVLQGSMALEVNETAIPTKLVGLKDVPTLFQEGSFVEIDVDNIVMIDQYNRAITSLGTDYQIVATVEGDDYITINTGLLTGTIDDTTTSITIEGVAAGSQEITFVLSGTDIDDSEYDVTAKTIETSDIKTYAFDTISTIYANDYTLATATAAGQNKTLTLVGKDSSGKAVNLVVNTIVTAFTTSDSTIVGAVYDDQIEDVVDDPDTQGTLSVFGFDEGTATVAAWKGATKIAEVEIATNDAAPVQKTLSFDSNAADDLANLGTRDLLDEDADGDDYLTVKDQYGSDITPAGTWSSSDTSIATVSTLGVVTADDTTTGTVTISFVTTNGIVITVDITVV